MNDLRINKINEGITLYNVTNYKSFVEINGEWVKEREREI